MPPWSQRKTARTLSQSLSVILITSSQGQTISFFLLSHKSITCTHINPSLSPSLSLLLMNYTAGKMRDVDDLQAYYKPFANNSELKLENKAYSSNHLVMVRHSLPEQSARFRKTSGSTRYADFNTSSWGFNDDPETRRQKRVAKYRSYAVKGKVKSSISNGFRWIRNKYTELMQR